MRPHRKSYLKTVVAALGVSATSLGLVVLGWMLFESMLLRWVLSAALIVVGLVCLLVAVGGLFAFHEDAKERG